MPEGPWQDITINFIIDMPPSLEMDGKAYDAILVVINHYIKLVKYYSVLKTITAEQLDDLLVHIVFSSFGVPLSIVSDLGLFFTSAYWLALCHYLCIKQHLSMDFYLQIDS